MRELVGPCKNVDGVRVVPHRTETHLRVHTTTTLLISTMHRLAPLLAGALLSASSSVALAARPFVVDDARVVDEGACQVESWVKSNPDSKEAWALPACNPFGIELTAGMGFQRSDEPSSPAQRDYQFQGKTLFRPLETNDWGWGLAVGVVRHADINLRQNLLANRYFYVPISKSYWDDKFVLLTNIGGVDNRDEKRRGLLYGVGGEFYLTPRFMLLGEVYGATGFDRFSQAGVRYWIIPDHLQVDTTYGFQLTGANRTEWITLGFRFITKRFY